MGIRLRPDGRRARQRGRPPRLDGGPRPVAVKRRHAGRSRSLPRAAWVQQCVYRAARRGAASEHNDGAAGEEGGEDEEPQALTRGLASGPDESGAPADPPQRACLVDAGAAAADDSEGKATGQAAGSADEGLDMDEATPIAPGPQKRSRLPDPTARSPAPLRSCRK